MRCSHYGLSLLLCILSLAQGAAAATRPSEQEVTANIILELPRYVSFANPSSLEPTICVIADAGFYQMVKTVHAKRRVNQKLRQTEHKKINGCDVIYVADRKTARQLITKTFHSPILLVSNYANFIQEGGAISIVDANGRIEILLNLGVTKERGITLSPDLIELSARVIQ